MGGKYLYYKTEWHQSIILDFTLQSSKGNKWDKVPLWKINRCRTEMKSDEDFRECSFMYFLNRKNKLKSVEV